MTVGEMYLVARDPGYGSPSQERVRATVHTLPGHRRVGTNDSIRDHIERK